MERGGQGLGEGHRLCTWGASFLYLLAVACSSARPSVRPVTVKKQFCVLLEQQPVPVKELMGENLPRAEGAGRLALRIQRVGVPATPLLPPSAPALKVLAGQGQGNGIPHGVLRLLPEGGGLSAEAEAVSAAGTKVDLFVRYASQRVASVGTGASAPQSPPEALPSAKNRQRDPKKKRGRIYVTYTKYNRETHRRYIGRTSMVIDLEQNLRLQAQLAVAFRDMNHHIDESDEPSGSAYERPALDVFDVGVAVDYSRRYEDPAYGRIRGREQQLIDFHGGAQSDTGKPYRTENAIRGVAKDNRLGREFHEAASARWGEIHPYTGN